MKYCSGNTVRIAPWLDFSASLYEFTVCKEMTQLTGNKTISGVHRDYYTLTGCDPYRWSEDMLIPTSYGSWPEGTCVVCGETESLIEVDMGDGTTVLMCPDDAALYALRCDDCGKYFIRNSKAGTRIFTDDINSACYCANCLSKKDVCPSCGEIMDEAHEIDGVRMCSSCVSLFAKPCKKCGELHLTSKMKIVENNHYCSTCESTLEYHTCIMCGKTYLSDSALCNDCMPYYTRINGYHHGPKFHFFGSEPVMMGMELEVDDGDSETVTDAATETCKIMDYHAYCCRDGSLESGFEIITHPHTYEGMQNLPWESLCSYLTSNGWRSHNTSTAGMHIHINRKAFKDEDAISRFILFFENNWDFAKAFSRRGVNKLETWAAPYLSQPRSDGSKKFTKHDVDGVKYSDDRRHCVNTTNENTIEVRLFRGSLNPNTIRASIELVYLLVNQANALSDKDAETFSPAQWLKDASENLHTYCEGRRIPLN